MMQPSYLSRYSDSPKAGSQRFDSREEQEIFLLPAASIMALGFTQPPVQWVPGNFSAAVKRQVRETVELYLHSIWVFMV
jgi:hypothetical protein